MNRPLPLPVEVLCWALALLALASITRLGAISTALAAIGVLIIAGLASQET